MNTETRYENGIFRIEPSAEKSALLRKHGARFNRENGFWETPFLDLAKKAGVDKKILEAAREEKLALYNLSFSVDSLFAPPLPDGRSLFPFQRAGVFYLLQVRRGLLADEMGLGKTIQAIVAGNCWAEDIRRVLVICPAALKLNWLREWERWSTLALPVRVLSPKDVILGPPGVTIVNYDILDRHVEALQGEEWDYLILDECHYLKNREASRTQLVYGKPGIRAKRVAAITGTPIINRPKEIFTTLRYLRPDGWPTKTHFERRYCVSPVQRVNWAARQYEKFDGAANLDELQARMRSVVMCRRLKAEVLKDLPAKTHQVIPLDNSGVDMGSENAIWTKIKEKLGIKKEKIEGEDFQRVLGLFSGDGVVLFHEISRVRKDTGLSKLPGVIRHLEGILEAEEKAVCFCWHKDVAKKLTEKFAGKAVTVTGDTSLPARDEAVTTFQERPEIRLFIGNIQAAGVGITLTAARLVVFAELPWQPGVLSQASDRCHRIGQTENVLVQYLVLEDSLDARMAEVLVAKAKVIENALNKKEVKT